MGTILGEVVGLLGGQGAASHELLCQVGSHCPQDTLAEVPESILPQWV
ncbi:MAG: hypothetical protein ACREXM_14185 [Gammaproteobacteria bacterium]